MFKLIKGIVRERRESDQCWRTIFIVCCAAAHSEYEIPQNHTSEKLGKQKPIRTFFSISNRKIKQKFMLYLLNNKTLLKSQGKLLQYQIGVLLAILSEYLGQRSRCCFKN
jgi:hypothetical protein